MPETVEILINKLISLFCGPRVNPDLSRSWLLPVLRESIADTELAFFADYFLSLAKKFSETGMA
jgi:hypothetical protein